MQFLKKVLFVIFWPFRYWRLLLAGLVLLVAAYISVDQVLLYKLAEQTEQIKQSGRPVTFADLHMPAYTSIDNAFTVYEQVMDMIKKEPNEKEWEQYASLVERYIHANPCAPLKEEKPLSEEELAKLGEYFQKLQPAFDLLFKSKDCRACIIPDIFPQSGSTEALNKTNESVQKWVNGSLELVRHAAAKGLWEYRRGNLDGAFNWFALGLNIANNSISYPTLLGTLVRIGSAGRVLTAVQLALHDGDVPVEFPASFDVELQKFLDRNIYAQTYQNERLYSQELATRMGLTGLSWHYMRPFYVLNELKRNQFMYEYTDIMKMDDYAQQEASLDAISEWCKNSSRLYLMAKLTFPAVRKSVSSIRRGLAQAEACNISIKLKQFQQKNGSYPQALSELNIPLTTDPCSGKPFKYEQKDKGFVLTGEGEKGTLQGLTNVTWCAVK
jgi:hypothetical protein